MVDFGAPGFQVNLAGIAQDGGAWSQSLLVSLAQSQQLFAPTVPPETYCGQNTSYRVFVMGDPFAASPGNPMTPYDGTGLHILVVPDVPIETPDE